MEVWVPFARALSHSGFGVLGLDLRGHGESAVAPDGQPIAWRKLKAGKIENDFADMTRDVEAAVLTLGAQGVSEESVALIGFTVGGSIALKYAAVHPKVPLIVLISPGMSYQEVLTVNAVRAYKGRPILMVYAGQDRRSAAATAILHEFAKRSAGEANTAVMTVPGRPGPKMLDVGLTRRILDWLENPVKTSQPTGPSPGSFPASQPSPIP
jgi:pimeloyl-ACP methyl ester carboxylesterase